MIPALIWKEIKDRKGSLIAYTLAGIGLVLLYVALYPSLQGQSQTYAKLMESMPKGFAEAFGVDANFLATLEGYIASEMFSFMWPLLAIFFVVSRAGSAIAGEIEKGTIGTLLSQPVARTKIYWTKAGAAIISFSVFALATVLTTIPFAYLFKLNVALANYFVLALIGFLFGLAIYGFAFMLSAASSDKTKVYGIVGGLLFVMYAANVVSALTKNLSWLKYTSVFHYFDAPAALVHGNITLQSIVLFTVVAFVSLLIGQIVFTNRDISI